MILTHKSTRINVVLLQADGQAEVRQPGDLQQFMSWWKERARERGVRPQIDGADWRLGRTMLGEHGLEHLKKLARMFWSYYADPLVTGEYSRHMILFRSKMAEVERDLANMDSRGLA